MLNQRHVLWLSFDDIEEHFIALCEVNKDLPNIGDPVPPLHGMDPFKATERFIREFVNPNDDEWLRECLDHLVVLHRGMQPKGGISDAD